MEKILKMVLVLMVASILSAGTVFGADQEQKRDRKKDGSCQDGYIAPQGIENILAADREQKRDRKRDGSCQDGYIAPQDIENILAADRDQKRDRKRDGSCQG